MRFKSEYVKIHSKVALKSNQFCGSLIIVVKSRTWSRVTLTRLSQKKETQYVFCTRTSSRLFVVLLLRGQCGMQKGPSEMHGLGPFLQLL